MKKSILFTAFTLLLLCACNGNKASETEQEKMQEVLPSEKEIPEENSYQEQEAKEARKLDSLRQVKEHGHAH